MGGTVASYDEFRMNFRRSWPTSENSVKAKFAEFTFHALQTPSDHYSVFGGKFSCAAIPLWRL
jgi:hypothetical protein